MLYSYHCPVCKHEFEREEKITDRPNKECPRCKTWAANRIITGGNGFVLKGDGWAKDGYSKGKKE